MHKKLRFPNIDQEEEGNELQATLRKYLRTSNKGNTKNTSSMPLILQSYFQTETPLQRIFNKKLLQAQSRSISNNNSSFRKKPLRSNTIISYLSQLPPKNEKSLVNNLQSNSEEKVTDQDYTQIPVKSQKGSASCQSLKKLSKVERQQFNCTKIGPAVQRGLDSEYDYLPILKTKNVNHEVNIENYKKDNQFRRGYLELIKQFKLSQQKPVDKKIQEHQQQQENLQDLYKTSLTNQEKNLLSNNQYNQRFLKELIDINCLLRGYDNLKQELSQNEQARQRIIDQNNIQNNQQQEELRLKRLEILQKLIQNKDKGKDKDKDKDKGNDTDYLYSNRNTQSNLKDLQTHYNMTTTTDLQNSKTILNISKNQVPSLSSSQDKQQSAADYKKLDSSKLLSNKQSLYNEKAQPQPMSTSPSALQLQQKTTASREKLILEMVSETERGKETQLQNQSITKLNESGSKIQQQTKNPNNKSIHNFLNQTEDHMAATQQQTAQQSFQQQQQQMQQTSIHKDSLKSERTHHPEYLTKVKEFQSESEQSYYHRYDTKLASFKNVSTKAFEIEQAQGNSSNEPAFDLITKERFQIINKQERVKKLNQYKQIMNSLNKKKEEEEKIKQKYIRIMSKVGKSKRSVTIK